MRIVGGSAISGVARSTPSTPCCSRNRTISRRNSGFPSVWACRDVASHAGALAPVAVAAATKSCTSSALNPAEIDARNVGCPCQSAKRIGQRMLARQLGRPIGAEQQQPAVGDLGCEEFEQAQRRRIGPMQVVQHHHGGPAAAQAGEQLADRFEHAESGLGGVRQAHRRLQVRHKIADFRHDVGDVARTVADIVQQRACIGGAQRRRGSPAPMANTAARRPPRGCGPKAPYAKLRGMTAPAPARCGSCRCRARPRA